MTSPDSSTTEKPATAAARHDSRPAGDSQASPAGSATVNTGPTSGSNLKAGLVLLLVLVLALVAGAGYLIKNNETVARQLLSWNIQIPGWLLPASVSKSVLDAASSSAQQSSLSDSAGAAPSTGAASEGLAASGAAPSPATGGSAGMADPANTPITPQAQGSTLPAPPPALVRPSPQLDPAFRQSLEAIDRLARSLAALPVGPQKPSLPGAVAPKPSGSLLAGVQAPAPDSQDSPLGLADNSPSPQVLEPGVFEKSLKFLQSLVRVQSVQGSDFAAQPQAFYQLVGQQMQAQLAAARLALLLGEVSLAARELQQTESLLERHFDKADPKVFQLQAEFSGLRRQVESLQ